MIGYGQTGVTHDFFAYNSAGEVWNGSAFVSFSAGSYTSYRITATETGTGSGVFTGTRPASTARYELRVQAGTLAGSYVVWAETAKNIERIGTQAVTASGTVNFTVGNTLASGTSSHMLNVSGGVVAADAVKIAGIDTTVAGAGAQIIFQLDGWVATLDDVNSAVDSLGNAILAIPSMILTNTANTLLTNTAGYVTATNGGSTTSVTITPLTGTVSAGEVTGQYFTLYQNPTTTVTIVVTDEDGTAVNLSGKTVRFTASAPGTPNTAIIDHDNSTVGGLTISGGGNNNVQVTFAGADTTGVRDLIWAVWNVTDDTPVAQGKCAILSISQKV